MKARAGARDAARAALAGIAVPDVQVGVPARPTVLLTDDEGVDDVDEVQQSASESSGEDWDMEGLE